MAKSKKAVGLRIVVPPYWAATRHGSLVVPEISGDTFELLERRYVPPSAEIRATLISLRSNLGWSRSSLSAFCGVSKDVVRRWETGERSPNGAARRLIWLLYKLLYDRDSLESALDVMLWGNRAHIA